MSPPCLHIPSTLAHVCLLALLALGNARCAAPSVAECEPIVGELALTSYNLANRTGEARESIAHLLRAQASDFMALQECSECDDLLTLLPTQYALTENRRAGVAIVFDAQRWIPIEQDTLLLGSDDDGWGDRVMHWARFEEAASSVEVVVASTHWCVPIRNDDDACSSEQLVQYAERSLVHLRARFGEGCTILFAGDLNLFGESERQQVSEVFSLGDFDDLMAMDPIGDVEHTFVGNSWAPAARLDYVFARVAPTLVGGHVDRSDEARGASDHFPINVEFGVSLGPLP